MGEDLQAARIRGVRVRTRRSMERSMERGGSGEKRPILVNVSGFHGVTSTIYTV